MVVDPSDISTALNPNLSISLKYSSILFCLFANSNKVPPVYVLILYEWYNSFLSFILSSSYNIEVPHPYFNRLK